MAALLAFFLGGLGIHRYYLGIPHGTYYLFWIWLFVPIIKAIKEGIAFSRFDQAQWDEKFNQGRVPQHGKSATVGEMAVIVVLGLIVYALLSVWLLFLIAAVIFFLDQA